MNAFDMYPAPVQEEYPERSVVQMKKPVLLFQVVMVSTQVTMLKHGAGLKLYRHHDLS
ncbi:MAG: hypothetical protein ACOY90_02405 [Candidatus Zhuqueibacterota bacterium]